MQIGQTYKIPVPYHTVDSSTERHKIGTGILIQETPHLLVFEYKNSQGDVCRTSIRKSDFQKFNRILGERLSTF